MHLRDLRSLERSKIDHPEFFTVLHVLETHSEFDLAVLVLSSLLALLGHKNSYIFQRTISAMCCFSLPFLIWCLLILGCDLFFALASYLSFSFWVIIFLSTTLSNLHVQTHTVSHLLAVKQLGLSENYLSQYWWFSISVCYYYCPTKISRFRGRYRFKEMCTRMVFHESNRIIDAKTTLWGW